MPKGILEYSVHTENTWAESCMMDANANSQGHKREEKNASNDAKFRASAPLKTRLFVLQSQGNFFFLFCGLHLGGTWCDHKFDAGLQINAHRGLASRKWYWMMVLFRLCSAILLQHVLWFEVRWILVHYSSWQHASNCSFTWVTPSLNGNSALRVLDETWMKPIISTWSVQRTEAAQITLL